MKALGLIGHKIKVPRTPVRVNVTIVEDPMDPRFQKSSKEEMKGLVDRGSYKVVNKTEIPKGATIVKSRVQHSIKFDTNGNKKYKTRLVIQGDKDPDKGSVVTEAPTVLRSSVRMILTISQSFKFSIWSRDVKQAFIQSKDPLGRSLYIKPPKKPDILKLLGKAPNSYLHALKPIYGLSESPGY